MKKENIRSALLSNGWLLRKLFLNRWLLRASLRAWNGSRTTDKTIFANMIAPGQTVIDIGANVGTYTFFFSQLVAKEGSVHAFEPVTKTFEILQKRVATDCPLKNVTLVHSALGDTIGESTIYQPGTDHGQSSFVPHRAGSWSLLGKDEVKAQAVQVATLDSYIERTGLRTIDFLKVDVEGYELMCLKGAAKAIANWKPIIYLEVNPLWSVDFGYSPLDIASFLQSLGYTQLFLLLSGDLTRIGNPERQLGRDLRCSADMLCVHGSRPTPLS